MKLSATVKEAVADATVKSRKKRQPKRVLTLPDLEQAKTAVLNSLTSASGRRTYDHAIRESPGSARNCGSRLTGPSCSGTAFTSNNRAMRLRRSTFGMRPCSAPAAARPTERVPLVAIDKTPARDAIHWTFPSESYEPGRGRTATVELSVSPPGFSRGQSSARLAALIVPVTGKRLGGIAFRAVQVVCFRAASRRYGSMFMSNR